MALNEYPCHKMNVRCVDYNNNTYDWRNLARRYCVKQTKDELELDSRNTVLNKYKN